MKQYLLSIYQPDGPPPADLDLKRIMQNVQALRNDMTAALLLIQHTWAAPLMEAVARAGGIELMNEWLQPEHVLTIEPRSLQEGDDDVPA